MKANLATLRSPLEVLARRRQLQERLTAQVADTVIDQLEARGVAVVVRAEHLCMKMRGVGTQRASMVTTAYRGLREQRAPLRAEAMALVAGEVR